MLEMVNAKRLREDADYYGDYSELVAKNLLEEAEVFYKAASKIVLPPSLTKGDRGI